jgi:hypothetical protein
MVDRASLLLGLKQRRVLLLLVTVLGVACVSCARKGVEYRYFLSPDGKYRLVVFRFDGQDLAMPGQSGDAPGEVRLLEVSSGRVLERKQVDMVQTIDRVVWSSTNVEVLLFAEWKLPR